MTSYYEKNKEKVKKYSKEYKKNHPEKTKEHKERYKHKHPERIKKLAKERGERLRRKNGVKIKIKLSSEETEKRQLVFLRRAPDSYPSPEFDDCEWDFEK